MTLETIKIPETGSDLANVKSEELTERQKEEALKKEQKASMRKYLSEMRKRGEYPRQQSRRR